MSKIYLKWFGGMVPRLGEQNLSKERIAETGAFSSPSAMPRRSNTEQGRYATEAENTNLYSGELRPLIKPALSHIFCQPGDDCFYGPQEPEDNCPEMPPCPINGVAVEIITQPQATSAPSGGTATFTVEVNPDATVPVSYQWQRSGIAIPGEVGPTLAITAQLEDNLQTYSVIVSNPCAVCFSSERAPLEVYEGYRCDSFQKTVLGMNPFFYYPCDDDYPAALAPYLADVSGNDAHGTITNQNTLSLGYAPPAGQEMIDACNDRVWRYNAGWANNVVYGRSYGDTGFTLPEAGTVGLVIHSSPLSVSNRNYYIGGSPRSECVKNTNADELFSWVISYTGGRMQARLTMRNCFRDNGGAVSNNIIEYINVPEPINSQLITGGTFLMAAAWTSRAYELYIDNILCGRVSGLKGDPDYEDDYRQRNWWVFPIESEIDRSFDQFARLSSYNSGTSNADQYMQSMFYFDRELSVDDKDALYQGYLRNFEDFGT